MRVENKGLDVVVTLTPNELEVIKSVARRSASSVEGMVKHQMEALLAEVRAIEERVVLGEIENMLPSASLEKKRAIVEVLRRA